jgi:hypothetical protein
MTTSRWCREWCREWYRFCCLGLVVIPALISPPAVRAQNPQLRIGEAVPRDVREMYDRGLQFLVSTQTD